eukprot:3240710-Heterocapsa_arctica.AAC.1
MMSRSLASSLLEETSRSMKSPSPLVPVLALPVARHRAAGIRVCPTAAWPLPAPPCCGHPGP